VPGTALMTTCADLDPEILAEQFNGAHPPPPNFELLQSRLPEKYDKKLQVALLRNFLSPAEVIAVHRICNSKGVWEILDREDDLDYIHRAYRVENQMKKQSQDLYTRIMRTAWGLDGALWEAIPLGSTLEPELEYIVYDVAELGRPGTIEPHADNESMVTMIVMLAERADYEGGVSCFQGASEGGEHRSVELFSGDAVFFHGNECFHWITPVTGGRRVVLQMELSTGRRRGSCCGRWLEICVFALLFCVLNTAVLLVAWLNRIWMLLLPIMLVAESWMALLVLEKNWHLRHMLPMSIKKRP